MSRRSKRSKRNRPLTPRLHSLIDYGFAAGNLSLPGALKLPPAVTGVFAAFGVIQGTLNALTTQPYAAKKVVPFALHGAIEKSSAPLFVLAPLLAGAARDKRSRIYWLATGAALVTVYNLTDWDARRPAR
ncbi:hypothetical protein [Rathayibacter sp. VKM Ac-2927]|uniref:hypothetical protein n=1 Tax=Rathayibacter sp. VKM Ac-2927 TaxID=2929478 RepID=UPI001FB30900|nr:hypothetical protein [Rathayibacter sp. VKM Ac-2927]MCJ1688640.1 hypothetical protein [Rathayibacter sp. VKM Ac-2927]